MSSKVSVITASLPDRNKLLLQALNCVDAQTYPVAEHYVGIDIRREGGAAMKNSLIDMVETEWIQILDDDDILMPHHIGRLMREAADDVDVIYSYAQGENYSGWYNVPFNPDALFENCNISHNAIVRKSLFDRIGKFGTEYGYDWTFWCRAVAAGAKFVCVPEVTWEYRLSENWLHESREGQSAGYWATKEIVKGIEQEYRDAIAEKKFLEQINPNNVTEIAKKLKRS